MSHIGGDSSNITVVQRVTPALRVNPQAAHGMLAVTLTIARNPGEIF
jgi:hypothetical protein